MGSVAAAAVEAIHTTEGLEAAQTLVDRVARLPSPGGDFWRAAVQLESAAAAAAECMLGRSSATVQVTPEPWTCLVPRLVDLSVLFLASTQITLSAQY